MQVALYACKGKLVGDSAGTVASVTIRNMCKNPFIVLAIVVSMVCSPSIAGDLDELKAAFQNALQQLQEKDLEGFLACWHPEAVLYTRDNLFPIDRSESEYDTWADIVEDFFARIVAAEFRTIGMKYRVVGDMGMVWGRTRFAVDLKSGGGSDHDGRLTAVLVKEANGWQIVSWHSSAIPRQSE